MGPSLPLRLKGPASMGVASEGHHHRSTTKTLHKAFKSRFATRTTLKNLSKGKIEKKHAKGATKGPHKPMSKSDRKNRARQLQLLKQREHEDALRVFAGSSGAPRIVAVVPLSSDLDAAAAIHSLNRSVDISDEDLPTARGSTVRVERFKQTLQYIACTTNLEEVLTACRIADYVVMVLSPAQQVSEAGETLLRSIEGQGVSTVLTVVQYLDQVQPPKHRPQIVSSLRSFISHFFPGQDKLYSLDSASESLNAVRSLCTSTPKGIRWRDERSWLLVDDISRTRSDATRADQLVISGVVRSKPLQANHLLQLGDWGSFQIEKIAEAPSLRARKRKANEMAVDEPVESVVLAEPDLNQQDTAQLAPEEVQMDEELDIDVEEPSGPPKGVLLDDHHYFSEEEPQPLELPKRVPRGTSTYQSAWFLGDEAESGSDWEDEGEQADDVSMTHEPADGVEGLDQATVKDPTEAAPSEYQTDMFVDPAPEDEADEIAAYRSRRKTEQDDLEFPDEIELHPNVLARERLARYRGLKSLRTSVWETGPDQASQPLDWNRLLHVGNYRGTRQKVLKEAQATGIPPGTRVQITLRNAPLSLADSALQNSVVQDKAPLNVPRDNAPRALTAFSLLPHEQKQTAMHFMFTLDSSHPTPLKSKDELIMQCGPRRSVVHPLFSAPGNTPNDVHKFDRYLHPGRTAVATVMAPLTWGPVPTLFFQRRKLDTEDPQDQALNANGNEPSTSHHHESDLSLVGTGTALPPSAGRVIAKRIVLTGHPYKIHKRLVTIRYMFFNADDVRWFRALPLWTRRGRSGFVKESLGTHGYFKASFDARINPQDAVAVSLYKRVWPRPSRPCLLSQESNRLGIFSQETAPTNAVAASKETAEVSMAM